MIAQSLSQKEYTTNSFKPLAAYVLRIPNAKGDPLDWGLSTDHRTRAVAWAKAVNSVDNHLGWAIKETDLVQRMNKRATVCKSYHYVISFPAGEHPSREVLENIEDVLSSAIGYGAHQRLMAVHQDTPHLHMHVAINRIHPQTFKAIGSPHDHWVLQRTTAELEDIHGLIKDNHMPGSRIRDREIFRPPWQQQPTLPTRDRDLQAAFKAAARQASQARRQALAALHVKQLEYSRKLVKWHAERRTNARNLPLSRADRRSTNLYLREAAQSDHAARKQREIDERHALREQYQLLTWEAFMTQQDGLQQQASLTRATGVERAGPSAERGR